MEYRYEPIGVCSHEMIIEVDGDTIKKVTIEGGCAGNTVGVSRLIEGMKIDEAIKINKFNYEPVYFFNTIYFHQDLILYVHLLIVVLKQLMVLS